LLDLSGGSFYSETLPYIFIFFTGDTQILPGRAAQKVFVNVEKDSRLLAPPFVPLEHGQPVARASLRHFFLLFDSLLALILINPSLFLKTSLHSGMLGILVISPL
jgi:hypothetical protein